MLKKVFLIIILLTNFVFAYQNVKTTAISSNPEQYKNKNVLVYLKFDSISFEDRTARKGTFKDLNVKGIDYIYDLNNRNLVDRIKKLKTHDLITVKGKVVLDGFNPTIEVDDLVNGWIDTTLLPPTPSEITIKCPKCGEVFKYKITKEDYDKAVLSERQTDTITPVVTKPDVPVMDDTSTQINQDTETKKSKDGWVF